MPFPESPMPFPESPMPFPESPMPFPMPPLVNIAVKDIVPVKALKNCLTFYLAKYIVNISALQHYYFLQLQLICIYMTY